MAVVDLAVTRTLQGASKMHKIPMKIIPTLYTGSMQLDFWLASLRIRLGTSAPTDLGKSLRK